MIDPRIFRALRRVLHHAAGVQGYRTLVHRVFPSPSVSKPGSTAMGLLSFDDAWLRRRYGQFPLPRKNSCSVGAVVAAGEVKSPNDRAKTLADHNEQSARSIDPWVEGTREGMVKHGVDHGVDSQGLTPGGGHEHSILRPHVQIQNQHFDNVHTFSFHHMGWISLFGPQPGLG